MASGAALEAGRHGRSPLQRLQAPLLPAWARLDPSIALVGDKILSGVHSQEDRGLSFSFDHFYLFSSQTFFLCMVRTLLFKFQPLSEPTQADSAPETTR